MNYIVADNFIKLNIKWIVPFLVLPRIVLSVLDIPFGPTICSSIFIVVFLYLCKYGSFRKFVQMTPLLLWMLLIVYHHVNGYVKHVPLLRFPDYYHAIKMYCAVCIYSFLFCVDLKRTLKYLAISIFLWLILAIAPTDYNGSGRLHGKGVIAVMLGKYSAVLAVCVIYYKSITKSKVGNLLLCLIPPVVIVLLSQTRTAFGMILIQMIGYAYGVKMKGKIKVKTLVLTSFLFLAVYIGGGYLIDNTQIGGRLSEEKSLDYYTEKKIATGTFFDKIAGERLIYYVNGYVLFQKHLLTGIGYNNYQNVTKGVYPMHVEYMVHLCEGGIIAFALFCFFWFSIIKRIIRKHYDASVLILLSSSIVMQLFSSMYSVSFDQEIPVIIYGLLIAAGSKMLDSSEENFYSISTQRLISKRPM